MRIRSHRRTAAVLTATLTLLVGVAAAPVVAKTDAKTRSPRPPLVECRGIDMLDELKSRDPDTHARVLADAARTANGEAMLWRIEKAGAAPSHLFGTMHVTDNRITSWSPAVTAAIGGSRTVLLEVADLSPKALMSAITRAARLLVFTDGRRLDTLLEADEFAKVQAAVEKSGLPGHLAVMFKPWLISTLLAVSECEKRNADVGHPVLDSKIALEAQARKIPVVGLETVDSQLAAMAAVPDAEQIAMLRMGLKFTDRSNDMLETLTRMYLNRQMGAAMPFNLALAASAGVEAGAFGGFQRELLVKRNRKMLDGAMPHLVKGGAFVAVGALHLPGETGLVQLLKDAGYTVTPVE